MQFLNSFLALHFVFITVKTNFYSSIKCIDIFMSELILERKDLVPDVLIFFHINLQLIGG